MAVVSGVVLERYSNKPLAGVPVSIGSVMTYTDGAGRFSVFVPDMGSVSVSVSAANYEAYYSSMNAAVPGFLNITLNPQFRFM